MYKTLYLWELAWSKNKDNTKTFGRGPNSFFFHRQIQSDIDDVIFFFSPRRRLDFYLLLFIIIIIRTLIVVVLFF